jgi:hypothetical protein
MNSYRLDNPIFFTTPPTVKADDITSTRPPRRMSRRKSWPPTNRSI